MSNFLIILSGGIGSRMHSSVPKQYIEIAGRPVLRYTLQEFDLSLFSGIVIVLSDPWREFVRRNVCTGLGIPVEKILFAPSGGSRQESVLNGLETIRELASTDDVVAIHDGARPCPSPETVRKILSACEDSDGAMPVLHVKDTMYMSSDGKRISRLLNRDELFIGQTPEGFKFGPYYRANLKIPKEELPAIRGSSELAFRQGLSIALIEGDERNFKITTQEDLEMFREIVRRRNL